MKIRQVLKEAADQLLRAGVETPQRDARLLMVNALGVSGARLSLMLDEPMPASASVLFQEHIQERIDRRPVSKILKYREFFEHRFMVTDDVLDPRPETESLVTEALEFGPVSRILDFGTGSGCILLSLLAKWPEATGLGTDISPAALEVAKANARSLELNGRAEFQLSDWGERVEGTFDLILSNPPYVTEQEFRALSPEVSRWDPRIALTPEGDGLDAYRRIAETLRGLLAPEGRAIFEFGRDQEKDVAEIFLSAGLSVSHFLTDLNKHVRGIVVAS